MIIRDFDGSENGGFDPRNYSELGVIGSLTPSLINTKTTLLNVTGEGYIDLATAGGGSGTVETCKVTITIDGVAKTFTSGSTGLPAGFSTIPYICGDSVNSNAASKLILSGNYYVSASFSLLTSGTNTYSDVALAKFPIYFNESLKIELEATATPLNPLRYSIIGGLLT